MEICSISPVDLRASSSNPKYGEPRPLKLGCRIFISHSGRDKNFVRFLHDKLVDRLYCEGRLVFFDEESLPTAEPISMENILAEARGCELGILVLTKDFFIQTPNPMLELEALTTSNVRLLPLFLGISVDEFKKMKHENEWEEQWKEWLKGDEQRIGAWKRAINFVDRFSGLEKCKRGLHDLHYIIEVVDEVARIVPPAVTFSAKGVCGMDRICQIVKDMYNQCASRRASDSQTQVVYASGGPVWRDDGVNSLDLVGIYGFAGLGKSTLCRSLCDLYRADFRGRVFLLDLASVPISSQTLSQTFPFTTASMLRMHDLLSRLTRCKDYVESTDMIQIQNLLQNWIKKDPIFLAIDNILDSKALDEALFYLHCDFAKGSKVFITSRSRNLLEDLLKKVVSEHTSFSHVIEHIPALTLEEARDIFLHEIPNLRHMLDVEDEVKDCVSMCVIHKDMNLPPRNDKFYHPLMLKSSAASIGHSRSRNVDLKSNLREFLQSTVDVDRGDAWDAVFEMLDITSYAILGENEKKVLHDLALYCKVICSDSISLLKYTWIQAVYSHLKRKRLDKILLTLEDLSFINSKDYGNYGRLVQVHDLIVEFSMRKMMQGADAKGFNPHVLLLDNGTQLTNSAFALLLNTAATRNEWPSKSSALSSVRTISVSRCWKCPDPEQLDLRNFKGVEVLHVVDNPGLHEVLLSCSTIAGLRSFIVRVCDDSASLRCIIDECWPMPNGMMMGGQLVWVELEGNIILSTCRKTSWWQEQLCKLSRRHSMGGLGILRPFLCNLQHLTLSRFPAKSIDVTTCTNLITMRLSGMPRLGAIHGLETLTNLKELYIVECGPKIIDVTNCINLERLVLSSMGSLGAIHGLQTLTSLGMLEISECGNLQMLSIPASLGSLFARVGSCSSLERISPPTRMAPRIYSAKTTALSGPLYVINCPAVRSVGLLDQYNGTDVCWFEGVAIQDLVEPFETGSLKFKATVKCLLFATPSIHSGSREMLVIEAEDVQPVGLFISALVKSQGTDRCALAIRCKKNGDCGCDKIEPFLGPELLPFRDFLYRCPQVRSIVNLPIIMGKGLRRLDLQGCRNVEAWPDFATMTSLQQLNLSHTSLKEWPRGVQLLVNLRELDIQGCWQLPAEEMINIITCNPLGCNSVCSRGSFASLLADLKGCRRDRGSVADALDSRWPEIVLLFREQWRYLRYPCGTLLYSCPMKRVGSLCCTELCYLIRIMYDLWFGVEGKAGSAHKHYCPCADGVPRINEKLKRLLCSEDFMSLPFYVWRIGRTRAHALDEWEVYPWPEGYEIYMAFALIGSASIGCFNAPLNDELKDRMVNFIQSFADAQPERAVNEDFDMWNVQLVETPDKLDKDAHERLVMRVGDAVCQIARTPSVAAALGQEFLHITMDGLKASYNTLEILEEARKSLTGWMKFICCKYLRCRFEIRKDISFVAAELGKASMHTMSLDDDLGARVLLKIMPKILPISALKFHGLIHGDNENNCCCRESNCLKGRPCVWGCCYLEGGGKRAEL